MAATVPGRALNLANAPLITSSNQVGLTWEDANYNGGSPVLDYKVSYTEVSATNNGRRLSVVDQ